MHQHIGWRKSSLSSSLSSEKHKFITDELQFLADFQLSFPFGARRQGDKTRKMRAVSLAVLLTACRLARPHVDGIMGISCVNSTTAGDIVCATANSETGAACMLRLSDRATTADPHLLLTGTDARAVAWRTPLRLVQIAEDGRGAKCSGCRGRVRRLGRRFEKRR